jgi:hypothetical protein
MSDLQDLTRDLEAAPARIAQRVAGRMTRAQRELLGVARRVVHVRTGKLRDSLSIDPPSYVGADLSEFGVSARVSYAGYEVAKGGEHDYVARTLEEGQAVIDSAANDIADIVASTIVGQG